MAGIRILGPTSLLSAGDMSGNLSSKSMDLQSLQYAAFEIVWTGTPTGTFSIDGSFDNVSFYPTNTSINNPAGAAGSTLVNLGFPVAFRYIRVSYTRVGGSGSLTINGMAKSGGGS